MTDTDRFTITQTAALFRWGYWRTRDAALRGLGGLQLLIEGQRLYVTRDSVQRLLAQQHQQVAPPPAA